MSSSLRAKPGRTSEDGGPLGALLDAVFGLLAGGIVLACLQAFGLGGLLLWPPSFSFAKGPGMAASVCAGTAFLFWLVKRVDRPRTPREVLGVACFAPLVGAIFVGVAWTLCAYGELLLIAMSGEGATTPLEVSLRLPLSFIGNCLVFALFNLPLLLGLSLLLSLLIRELDSLRRRALS